MNEFQTVLQVVLPVFCVAGLGFLARRLKWLTSEADHSLLKVSINLFIPCLVFRAILGNKALSDLGNLVLAPLAGFSLIVLGLGAGWLLRRAAGVADVQRGRTFAASVGIYNWGYVPIPLVLLLFDSETMGVLFVFNVGAEIAVWTLGLLLMTGAPISTGWKRAVNAPVMAIVVTLILNFAGAEPYVPGFVLKTTDMLGSCAIPLGLVLVGATLADEFGEFHADVGWRTMAVAVGLRLGVLSILFLLAARHLPVSTELKRIIVIQSAMPAASFPIIMAKYYGGHVNTALRVVIGTTVVSLVTIPLWIPFGLRFVGVS